MKSDCKAIIIDVDGVLVHSVFYSETGERFKSFNARDNRAIREMVAAGFVVLLMSQSKWQGLKHFAEKVGAEHVCGIKDKKQWVDFYFGHKYFAIADDITDMELLKGAVHTFIPNNAFDALYDCWHRCASNAGEGCVADMWAEIKTFSE